MTDRAGRPVMSVVVMGYLNEKTICGAVLSVLEQKHDETIEVLVVTSGNDRSAELVRDRFPAVRVMESPDRLFPGAARNAGLRAVRGDFVAFLAADCRAAPGWVAARLTAHRAGYAAVAAAVAPEEPPNAVVWAGHYLLFPSRLAGTLSEEIAHPDDRAHGLSYSRSLLERMGPFREDMRIGEDTEMAHRLRDERVPIWLAADAVITHPGPRRIGGLMRDHYLRGTRRAKFIGPPPPRSWSRTRAVLGTIRGIWRRLRWAKRQVLAVAPDHRRNLLRVGPLMVAGTLAHQAGWARARLATIGAATEGGVAANGASAQARRMASAGFRGAHGGSSEDLRNPPYAPDEALVALRFESGPDGGSPAVRFAPRSDPSDRV